MFNKLIWIVVILAITVFSEKKEAWADETVYSFGVVPQYEANELASIWLPILKELERHTGFKFKLVGSPKIPDFEMNFTRGDFDFAYMNPYHSRLAQKSQGYVALVRDGKQRLFGVLVTKKDNDIETISQLEGKEIAFPAPNALGASLILRADLEQLHHISFIPKYVQTHSSVYLNVVLGRMAAGGGVMSTLINQPKEIQDKLHILYQTRSVASHPVMAHPRVPLEHQQKVINAFLAMGQTTEGIELLKRIPILQIVTSSPEDYEELDHWGLENYFENQEH